MGACINPELTKEQLQGTPGGGSGGNLTPTPLLEGPTGGRAYTIQFSSAYSLRVSSNSTGTLSG